MTVPAIISLVYGLLVMAGGWLGHLKAGSRPSLVMGTMAGGVLWVAGLLIWAKNPAGVGLALVVGLLLLGFFGFRYAKGKKFMPAGLMVLVSLLALIGLWLSRAE